MTADERRETVEFITKSKWSTDGKLRGLAEWEDERCRYCPAADAVFGSLGRTAIAYFS